MAMRFASLGTELADLYKSGITHFNLGKAGRMESGDYRSDAGGVAGDQPVSGESGVGCARIRPVPDRSENGS